MTTVHVTLDQDTREALARTAKYLRAQVTWLQETGSRQALPQVVTYAETLERLAAASAATLDADQTAQVQQSAFLLEGARNSYRNAEFKDRAEKVSGDVARLYDLVKTYNGEASAAKDR